MKRLKKILFLALMVTALSCLFCQPAFAISEEEVQAQVDAVGKEAVSGNVLIWFMCAIGFLKVSQKIDSFMASLGVNVGHTGGSMLAEAMIAARGFSGFKSFASNHFAGGRSSHSSHVNASGGGKGGAGFGAGFASGGLAGVIKRNVTNNAVKTATTPPDAKPSGLSGLVGGAAGGIGGHIYASSVSKGGNFANNVIGSVATGSITQMGTMTGDKAVDALHSYMGHAALEPGAENTCVELNPHYVEVGKKVVPEATWICADVLDPFLPDLLGQFDFAIANPPFGRIANNYRKSYMSGEFEYMVIEAASRIAKEGAFIIPQMSAPFVYSGTEDHRWLQEGRARTFEKRTGILLEFNQGIDTAYYKNDWHCTAPICEIVCCDFAGTDTSAA